MNRYTIRCTEEQTHKALKLGAPILKEVYAPIIRYEMPYYCIDKEKKTAFHIPTAEQMIGWLREEDLSVEVMNVYQGGKKWISYIWNIKESQLIKETIEVVDYKEAILVGIDAALEYLIKKKGE